ncbi:ABC transporter ATP-binding protein [Companilactobacillus metriopterae]|uniref:ABC transporter ATP-binding protein n=1 Tax=Companilactobacillus metriopterae TaxID=1909267 RepID=UPI00100B63E4|nr:ATP-binding cassette domain-containing protein [Companilactobacillus metriopterae]
MVEIASFRDYSFRYPNNQSISLKNINLQINSGDFAVIIGETGSGKSTLLRQFIPELNQGVIEQGNFEYKSKRDVNNIIYISQFVDNQMVTETPREELEFVLENYGFDDQQKTKKIAEISSYLDIVKILDYKESQLSGGQKQLVNLAAGLILNPETILLDEPTSQLDPVSSEKFLNILKKINIDMHITILFIDHMLDRSIYLANRLIIMNDGQIILDLSTNEAIKEFSKLDSFQNYLTQNDRFVIANNLNKVSEFKSFPVTNYQLHQLMENYNQNFHYVNNFISSESTSEKILEVKNLTFSYEFNNKNIVDHLSFSLDKGKIYSILGPNGVGKSTLIKVLINQLDKVTGSIRLNNIKIKNDYSNFYKNVFYLPQSASLLFRFDTVKKELDDQLNSYSSSKVVLDELIKSFRFDELLDKNPYDLSGGQQELLALILGFIKNPELMILDEPTNGLDPNSKVILSGYLKNYIQNGGTVLMNTHDLQFTAQYCDQVSMMFDGKLTEFQTPKDFFEENYFYTTEINKSIGDFWPRALLWKDVEVDEH